MVDVIYDGDFGIDDALAMLYLAGRSDVRIAAVGSVHGNARADAAAANAAQVLAVAGIDGVPVAVGARRPMAQELDLGALVHGGDGLGGAARPTPRWAPVPESAAEQLVRMARREPGRYAVVATGPLTNVAVALLLEPELPRLLDRIVVMGGALSAPGNVTPLAEANIWHDPEAADLVLTCGAAITLVPLDVTMAAWLERPDLDRMAAAPGARPRFVTEILDHYLGFYLDEHGREGCPLHDPTAAALMVAPELATYTDLPLRVELRGEATRGMLVADRREYAKPEEPPVRVATGLDSRGLIEEFLSALLA